jgi:hypothetical protein
VKKYQYAIHFKEQVPNKKVILHNLDYAWRNTPSKNNFMNYNVYVLGPDQLDRKLNLYYKCLENQSRSNGNHITGRNALEEYESKLIENKLMPNYISIKSAPYVILYTQRTANTFNDYQNNLIKKKFVYEQTFPKDHEKYDTATGNAKIEIGMFANNFANKCLKYNIDISYVACVFDEWNESEWHFLDDVPLLIQCAGYGDIYRRDTIKPDDDLKPDFSRVVKLIGD